MALKSTFVHDVVLDNLFSESPTSGFLLSATVRSIICRSTLDRCHPKPFSLASTSLDWSVPENMAVEGGLKGLTSVKEDCLNTPDIPHRFSSYLRQHQILDLVLYPGLALSVDC